jgi:hypothetical protein
MSDEVIILTDQQGVKGDKGDPSDDSQAAQDAAQSAQDAAVSAQNATDAADDAAQSAQDATDALNHATSSFVSGTMILPGVNGVVGDGVTDDTAAIQALITATPVGGTVYLNRPPSGVYLINGSTLTVANSNVRFAGPGRDVYGVAFKRTVAGQILDVKNTGFTAENVHFIGNGDPAAFGVGATVNAIRLLGTVPGDIDARIRGCSFLGIATSILIKGRNVKVMDCTFSNSLNGVTIDGPLAGYHDGTWFNRGNTVRDNRFHGIGATSSDVAINVTTVAAVLHADISDNYFDVNGIGKHVQIIGTSAVPHLNITARGNKHLNVMSDAYTLTYVNHSSFSDIDVSAGSYATSTARGFVVSNCLITNLNNIFLSQLMATGIVARNNNQLRVNGIVLRGIAGDGIDVDSTNNYSRFEGVVARDITGWGFTGSPTNTELVDAELNACTLGQVNSTTIANNRTSVLTVLPPTGWFIISGTPSLASVNSYPGLTFDPNTLEQVTQMVQIPASWNAFHVDLVWAAYSATAGDVRWGVGRSPVVSGSAVISGPSPVETTGAGDATVNTKVTRVLTSIPADSDTFGLRIYRNATHAADTLTADAALFAVRLVKA